MLIPPLPKTAMKASKHQLDKLRHLIRQQDIELEEAELRQLDAAAAGRLIDELLGSDPDDPFAPAHDSSAPAQGRVPDASGAAAPDAAVPATARQLDFLRSLAAETGSDCRLDPARLTSAEAHRLISKLLAARDAAQRRAGSRRFPGPPPLARRAGPRPASARQISFLRQLADRAGRPLDDQMVSRLDTAGANRLIDDLKHHGSGAPTPRQIKFARKLARLNGIPIPDDCIRSRDACSRFIEAFSCGRMSRLTD